MPSNHSSLNALFDESVDRDLRSRIRYTFTTGFMSDINFVVGDYNKQKTFAAHRYILAINSPVFHAMFYGNLAEVGTKISIPDGDSNSFGEFLRFLYTEDCAITEDNVMSIIYLATKYIVPSLKSKCVRFLQKTITPESAFAVLSQAIHFCANGLEENCWNAIDAECNEALKSEGFLGIEHSLLCELLSRETLNIKEIDLFRAILKWSESECQRQGLKGSDEDKRYVLGSALNLLRFPTMGLEEFAGDVVQKTNLLPEQDIITIFLMFSGRKTGEESLKYSCKPREHPVGKSRCSRFSPQKIVRSRAGRGWCYANNTLDALCFRVSCSVKIHGVRSFGDEDKSVYRLKVSLLHGNRELSSCAGEFRSEVDEDGVKPTGFDVWFPEPVKLESGEMYTLSGSFSGPQSLYGQGGEKTVIANGVQFMFCSSEQSNNGTSVFHGQFPQVIFSKE